MCIYVSLLKSLQKNSLKKNTWNHPVFHWRFTSSHNDSPTRTAVLTRRKWASTRRSWARDEPSNIWSWESLEKTRKTVGNYGKTMGKLWENYELWENYGKLMESLQLWLGNYRKIPLWMEVSWESHRSFHVFLLFLPPSKLSMAYTTSDRIILWDRYPTKYHKYHHEIPTIILCIYLDLGGPHGDSIVNTLPFHQENRKDLLLRPAG